MATVVECDHKALFSIATTPRCRGGRYSFPWIAPLPLMHTLYCWVLSKEVSSTIFKVIGMMRAGIERRPPYHLRTINTLGQWAGLWVPWEKKSNILKWVGLQLDLFLKVILLLHVFLTFDKLLKNDRSKYCAVLGVWFIQLSTYFYYIYIYMYIYTFFCWSKERKEFIF